ncbi:hypothetical protein K505DRAFT_338110 [Melanomma pulvis-pyrius CBS 109.77]|uniref:Uncharacterized protein n=1 Tax=Melanomma pulvis-pyrius CBS 109.77 TaxID=1314802 RepID=A0A6A6XAR7_9PLEO|nr:hypothetical protein K505DRAFT_338110 [Melanomma pulvis-pyrius CBS 109.77]
MSEPSSPRTPGERVEIQEVPDIETPTEPQTKSEEQHEQAQVQEDELRHPLSPVCLNRKTAGDFLMVEQKFEEPERGGLQRRRSGPTTLQKRIERARNSFPYPLMRQMSSSPPYHETRPRSVSNSTSHSNEQFIDGRMTPGFINQPPGMIRNFYQNSQNGQYEMGTTPNMAMIERAARSTQMRQMDDGDQGPSRYDWAVMSTHNTMHRDRAIVPRSGSMSSEGGYTSSGAGQDARVPLHELRERDQHRLFAQGLSINVPSSPRHQRHPAFNSRSALGETYPVAPLHDSDCDILEDIELETQDGSQNGAQNESNGIRRQLSQKSSFSRKRLRHSPEMGQWFEPVQPRQHHLDYRLQPSPIYTQRPRPSYNPRSREALNSYPKSRQRYRYPSNTPLFQLSTFPTTQPSPTPRPPSKKTWPARLITWLTTQPRSAEPNQHGNHFTTNLEHDIAPIHWLLRVFQSVVWITFFGIYMWSAWLGHHKLAFDCYELKTQLNILHPGTGVILPGDRLDIPSGVEIPAQYIITHDSMRSSLCILTPAIPETALFDTFKARWIIGVMCTGIAHLVELVMFLLLGNIMRKSGAYGNRTLLIRVFVGLAAAMAASAAVMKWASVVLGFKEM